VLQTNELRSCGKDYPAMPTLISTESDGFRTSTQEIQQMLERTRDQLTRDARVEVAFGEPRTIGERTLIPVAQVRVGFGGGGGAAPAGPEADDTTHSAAAGRGSGILGGASVRPMAVIEVTADHVVVRPIPDVQAIITRAFGFMSIALIAGLVLGGRRRRQPRFELHTKVGSIGSPHIKIGKQNTSMAPFARFGRHRAGNRH
jgi:uncharacterized spore protein YtfJ